MLDIFRVHGTSVPDFIQGLKAEGFDAKDDLFRGQIGVLVGPRGLDPQRLPPNAAAFFFPLWELNDPANLAAVASRDFHRIVENRAPGWKPVLREN